MDDSMHLLKFEKKVKLKDGQVVSIRFLSPDDRASELRKFIHELIDEGTFIIQNKTPSLKEENEWKTQELEKQKKNQGFLLVAKVNRKLAGTSGAVRDQGKGFHHVMLGIALAKPFRGIGLGEVLLRTNIELTKKSLKPKVISLGVFAPNRVARNLYRKLGFVQFGRLPKALLYNGKFIDHIFLRLKEPECKDG